MSRSRKKQPWVKGGAGHGRKQKHARAMRRNVRQILSEFRKTRSPDWMVEGPELPHDHEITNQYDIYDYRSWWDDPRGWRK